MTQKFGENQIESDKKKIQKYTVQFTVICFSLILTYELLGLQIKNNVVSGLNVNTHYFINYIN